MTFVNKNGLLGLGPNALCGYCFWAGINFLSGNMAIWAGDGNQVRAVQSWQTGVWYLIRVVLFAPAYTYDVWINNTAVAENLQPYWPHGDLVDSIILRSRGGANVYFDNVRVFADFTPASTITPSVTPARFVVIAFLAARIIGDERNDDWLSSAFRSVRSRNNQNVKSLPQTTPVNATGDSF